VRPDIVLVDMRRPDRDALDNIRALTEDDPQPIAMFIPAARAQVVKMYRLALS
jgi:AmiR/NasT family two-component response regulator